MPLHDEVVTEEYQHVDLSLGYHATDLEITAERPAEHAHDRRSLRSKFLCQRLGNKTAGRAGAEQMAMFEGTSVVTYPIQKFLLP